MFSFAKNRKIRQRKEYSKLSKAVEHLSKPSYCLLCNKKIESCCNSHIVPQFILKELSINGKISYGQSLFKGNHDIIETTKGINNAFTFKLICRECDNQKFKTYEDVNNLVNFDNLSKGIQKNVLCEMAIKTHLAHINMKLSIFNHNYLTLTGVFYLLKNCGLTTAYEIDIKEHIQYIKDTKGYLKANKFPYEILFNKLLDYKTGIATQTIISYVCDLRGNKIYDPLDFSENNHAKYIYLMILPYKNKTRILFYIEKKNINYVKEVIDDFNRLTEEEKVHFIFTSLIMYDEQFYINPTLKEKMRKDRRLINLYTKTDKKSRNWKVYKAIKHYKKYTNYLLESI
ncbi:MAG: hypothetical protein IJW59_00040 [Clostridia bacterium]|nr:hypothetical protein [Clostridia bacterium]